MNTSNDVNVDAALQNECLVSMGYSIHEKLFFFTFSTQILQIYFKPLKMLLLFISTKKW